jgi:Holliday junction resolvase RusA-like endonuclease
VNEVVVCEFVVEGRAASRGSKRAFRTKSGKINLVDGKNSYKYMRDIKACAVTAMAGREPIDGPVSLYWVAAFSRPKSHFDSRGNLKPSSPIYYTQTPDCSKLVRGIEDSLSGVVYLDDKQVVGYAPSIHKVWTVGESFTFVRVSRIVS